MPAPVIYEHRVSASKNRLKTHCMQGHPFEGENLFQSTDGSRQCRICMKSRRQIYAASEHGKKKRLEIAIRFRENNRESIREVNRLRTKKGREFIAKIKTGPCMDCGNKYPTCAMDLDHVRGVKKDDLSGMCDSGYTLKRLMEEVDKCELVCANCHRIRTYNRRQDNG